MGQILGIPELHIEAAGLQAVVDLYDLAALDLYAKQFRGGLVLQHGIERSRAQLYGAGKTDGALVPAGNGVLVDHVVQIPGIRILEGVDTKLAGVLALRAPVWRIGFRVGFLEGAVFLPALAILTAKLQVDAALTPGDGLQIGEAMGTSRAPGLLNGICCHITYLRPCWASAQTGRRPS